MTSLLRIAAVGAALFGFSTAAFAGGPSTTIVNNGNNNINIVLNIQAPQINVNLPQLPPMPGFPGVSQCNHGGYPPMGFPPMGPHNTIVNQGSFNSNTIVNRGGLGGPGGGATNQIVNLGNFNRNVIRNR